MIFKAYKVKNDHRQPSLINKKSQWTVSEWDELNLFIIAYNEDWTSPNKPQLWSTNGRENKIGECMDGKSLTDLYIAKYITDSNHHEWHGYPVSPRQYDIPPEKVLSLWLERGLIDKTDKSRIRGGKF